VRLTEFLLARISEREMLARDMQHMAAIGHPLLELRGGGTLIRELVDPARVLAECEAKRRIVERHGGTNWGAAPGDPYPMMCDECQDALWPCPTLRPLALPYADHPDYDESWRP